MKGAVGILVTVVAVVTCFDRGSSPLIALASAQQSRVSHEALAESHLQFAAELEEQGNLESAKVSYELAARLSSGNVAAWSGIGRTLIALGRTDEAVRVLSAAKQALLSQPNTHNATQLASLCLLACRVRTMARDFPGALDECYSGIKYATGTDLRNEAEDTNRVAFYLAFGYLSQVGNSTATLEYLTRAKHLQSASKYWMAYVYGRLAWNIAERVDLAGPLLSLVLQGIGPPIASPILDFMESGNTHDTLSTALALAEVAEANKRSGLEQAVALRTAYRALAISQSPRSAKLRAAVEQKLHDIAPSLIHTAMQRKSAAEAVHFVVIAPEPSQRSGEASIEAVLRSVEDCAQAAGVAFTADILDVHRAVDPRVSIPYGDRVHVTDTARGSKSSAAMYWLVEGSTVLCSHNCASVLSAGRALGRNIALDVGHGVVVDQAGWSSVRLFPTWNLTKSAVNPWSALNDALSALVDGQRAAWPSVWPAGALRWYTYRDVVTRPSYGTCSTKHIAPTFDTAQCSARLVSPCHPLWYVPVVGDAHEDTSPYWPVLRHAVSSHSDALASGFLTFARGAAGEACAEVCAKTATRCAWTFARDALRSCAEIKRNFAECTSCFSELALSPGMDAAGQCFAPAASAVLRCDAKVRALSPLCACTQPMS